MILNLGSRIVNCWMLPLKDGWLMIDTGYENGFSQFCQKHKRHHIAPSDIKYIFLTHAHDDHAGFLNDVLRITNAKVILHPNAIAGLQKGQNSFEGGCAGLQAYLFCQLMGLLGKGEHKYPPIKAQYLKRLIPIDSPAFQALHFPYRIIRLPGHTADHIALLAEDKLFCGDAAMNGFPSIKHTIIWIEDIQQHRRSWRKMIRLPIKRYTRHTASRFLLLNCGVPVHIWNTSGFIHCIRNRLPSYSWIVV